MKPHNQNAPGLGRVNDLLGALAKQYRAYVDKELAAHTKRGANEEREAA